MPEENSTISFGHLNKTLPVPFVIYADFEALLPKYKKQETLPKNSSWTVKHQKHKVCSYGYKVVCCYDDKLSKPYKSYRGENAAYKFLEAIFKEENEIDIMMNKFKQSKLIMNKDNWKNYDRAKT